MKNLFEHIVSNRENFTKQQRIFADFVLKNSKEIAFLNVAQISKQSGVSGATIVRFCKTLGFKGYPQFAKIIQQSIQSDLTAFNRYKFRKVFGQGNQKEKTPNSIYHKLLQSEISNTATLLESIDKKSYVECIDLMSDADRFCIIGNLASATLAMYLGQNLSKLNHHTDIIQHPGISSFAALEKLTHESVVFLISFPRYPKETLKMGRYVKKKGAKIIAVTDSPMSPLADISDIALYIPVNILSFGESYTAPIALLTVLCAEYSYRLPDKAVKKLQNYDKCTADLQFFEHNPQS